MEHFLSITVRDVSVSGNKKDLAISEKRRGHPPVWFWRHCCWTLSQRRRGRERGPGLPQPLQSVHSLSLTCWVEPQTRPPPDHLLREAFQSAPGYRRLLCSEWEESSTVARFTGICVHVLSPVADWERLEKEGCTQIPEPPSCPGPTVG